MSEVNLEVGSNEEKPKSVLEKPKRVRTQKQIDATAKLVASNKLKREAKKAEELKNTVVINHATPTPVEVVPPVPVVVETPVPPVPPVVVEVEAPKVEVEVKKPKRKYTKKVKEVAPKPITPPPTHYTNYAQNEESDYTSSSDDSTPEPKGISLKSDPVPVPQYFKLPRRYRVH